MKFNIQFRPKQILRMSLSDIDEYFSSIVQERAKSSEIDTDIVSKFDINETDRLIDIINQTKAKTDLGFLSDEDKKIFGTFILCFLSGRISEKPGDVNNWGRWISMISVWVYQKTSWFNKVIGN